MKKQVSIRLDESTLQRLDEIALQEKRTRTNMMEYLVLNYKKER